MSDANPACPVCRSGATSCAGEIDRFSPPFEMWRCGSCASFFRYPLPKDDAAFYDEGYYTQKGEFSYRDERRSFEYDQHVWRARLKTIFSHFPREGRSSLRFLDVGCAFGGFAATAGDYCESYGIDISPFAVERGGEFLEGLGLDNAFGGLYCGEITSGLFSLEPGVEFHTGFDIITLVEVAEHLADPAAYFREIYKLLRPGGLCLIQTANMEAWQAIWEGLNYHYFLPGHLTCYSARGLKGMLSEIGFSDFQEYIPVDFGVLPKLRKMRGGFTHPADYLKWMKTMRYHYTSKLRYKSLPRTSSYVLYARKW